MQTGVRRRSLAVLGRSVLGILVLALAAPLDGCSDPGATNAGEPAATSSATLQLISPTSGASWAQESVHRVVWAAPGAPADAEVSVLVSTDGGRTFAEVAKAPASREQALWTVPTAPSAILQLKASWRSVAELPVNLVLSPSAKRTYRWVKITEDAGFPARDGAGALTFAGKMWLIGGWNPNDHFPRLTSNDVWSSTDGVDWKLEKPNTFIPTTFDASADWEGRHAGGYAVYQNRMWIVGGDPLQGYYQGDVWSSADGRSWRRESGFAPWGARSLHYTLVFKDRLWVMGGQTMPDFVDRASKPAYQVFQDVWTSTDGAGWSRLVTSGPMWSPRSAIMQGAVLNDRMWVVAGGTYEARNAGVMNRTYTNDVWSSADGVSWRRDLDAAPFSPRQYHSLVAWDDRLWVIGGYNEDNLDGAWYSGDGVNWYSTPTTWDPRHAASVWVHKDAVWLTGGGNVDVWRLQRANP